MPEAAHDRPPGWRDHLTRRIVVWSLAVFAVSAFALVVLFALSIAANIYANLFGWTPGFGTFNAFTSRSYEPLLIVAGAALILLLMVRTENPFVVGFGILVVAALVVPSKDIIRFATILTGSQTTFEQFYPQGGAVYYRQHSRDLALRLAEAVEQTLGAKHALDEETEDRLIAAMEEEIDRARSQAVIDRLSRTGAITILRDHQNLPSLVERFESDERFIADLESLRREGLITYIYDDIEAAQITYDGNKVLVELDRRWATARTSAHAQANGQPVVSPFCTASIDPAGVADVAEVGTLRTLRIGSDPVYLRLRPMAGAEALEVELRPGAYGVDPFLCLYTGDGRFIYHDDDRAGGLGALLEVLADDFIDGAAFVGALSIGQAGNADLEVREAGGDAAASVGPAGEAGSEVP